MDTDTFSSEKYFGLVAKYSLEILEDPSYKKVINELFECYKRKGTVFTMGCGGSASTATHFAADLAKTTMVKDKPRFKAISLVDNIPLVSAWTNDEGWHSVFAEQLQPWIGKDDLLIGFSVHGGSDSWSQNLVAALKYAKTKKAKTISFLGYDGGAMKKMSDYSVVIKNSSEIYGTPVVEAMHVVLNHGLIFDLKNKIKYYSGEDK
jgi:D-sedoheptulose 7-phosphate isomerase